MGYATIIIASQKTPKEMVFGEWNPRKPIKSNVETLAKDMEETGQRTLEHPIEVTTRSNMITLYKDKLSRKMQHPNDHPQLTVPDGSSIYLINGRRRIEAAFMEKVLGMKQNKKKDQQKDELLEQDNNVWLYVAKVYAYGRRLQIFIERSADVSLLY